MDNVELNPVPDYIPKMPLGFTGLTPFSRQSKDICVYGDKDSGKNIFTTKLGFDEFCKGKTVYSNYSLGFPHVLITDLDQLKDCRDPGIFLGDDFEFWVSSRCSFSDVNKTLMNIILFFGKRSISVVYTCKFPKNVDVLLRRTTNFWVKIETFLKYDPKSIEEYDELIRYMENCFVVATVYNIYGDEVKREIIDNLAIYGQMYDTKEEIQKIGVSK